MRLASPLLSAFSLPSALMPRPFSRAVSALTLALALSASALAPAAVAQDAGAFTRLGFSARALGLGSALTADAFGPASAYHNPALAPFAQGQLLQGSAAFLSLDRQYQSLLVSSALQPRAGVAAGLLHAGVTGIEGRTVEGLFTEEYQTDEYAFFINFGLRLTEKISGGIGLRLYRNSLFEGVDPRTAIGLSAGVLAKPTENLAVALAMDDLLARYEWDTSDALGGAGSQTTDRFPIRFRLGAAYRALDGRLLLLAEAASRLRQVEQIGGDEDFRLTKADVRFGAEYAIAGPLMLRAGVDRLGDGARPAAGFALAQTLGEIDARIDYAASLEADGLGIAHFITLGVFL